MKNICRLFAVNNDCSFYFAGHNNRVRKSMSIGDGEIADTSVAFGEFEFKNVGEHPAVLRQVNPSCGCTVPEYDRGEIPAGSSSQIKVKFTPNTVDEGTQVLQQSHVQLIGNFKDTIYLELSAIVGK